MPPLYIGMELIRVRNFAQAQHFLNQAMKISDVDPLVWNEFGVISLYTNDYDSAITYFEKAVTLCNHVDVWITTFCNLGHAYRKKRKYKKAIQSYQSALNLAPREPLVKASIFSSLGFAHHLSNNLEMSINYYHKALGFNPNDRFTLDVLSRAISSIDLDLS